MEKFSILILANRLGLWIRWMFNQCELYTNCWQKSIRIQSMQNTRWHDIMTCYWHKQTLQLRRTTICVSGKPIFAFEKCCVHIQHFNCLCRRWTNRTRENGVFIYIHRPIDCMFVLKFEFVRLESVCIIQKIKVFAWVGVMNKYFQVYPNSWLHAVRACLTKISFYFFSAPCGDGSNEMMCIQLISIELVGYF